jgi:hypothetical protein
MEISNRRRPEWMIVLRWTARITTIALIAIAIIYLVGSYLDPSPLPDQGVQEIILFWD